MERFVIEGAKRLEGKVELCGAKNSVLAIIAASILNEGITRIHNCPKITDVVVMAKIIERLGGRFYFEKDVLTIDSSTVNSWVLPKDLTCKIRASVFMVGALISRFKYAETVTPGGCNIGERPIDIHLDVLKSLGIAVRESGGIAFNGVNAKSGVVRLKYPSVGATENAVMAAVGIKGVTVIENCALEPEISDLIDYLRCIGVKISVVQRGKIAIDGNGTKKVEVDFYPRTDRIEFGTFMLCGMASGGELEFENVKIEESFALCKILARNACKIYKKNDKIYNVKFYSRTSGFGKITAEPYPRFPTDLQPQITAVSCLQRGLTVVEDRVFPSRFSYATELKKMGADLTVVGNYCIVSGGALHGAVVSANDLRGGAALCVAALGAKGQTIVLNVSHIDRGYEGFDVKLKSLGAKIKRESL